MVKITYEFDTISDNDIEIKIFQNSEEMYRRLLSIYNTSRDLLKYEEMLTLSKVEKVLDEIMNISCFVNELE